MKYRWGYNIKPFFLTNTLFLCPLLTKKTMYHYLVSVIMLYFQRVEVNL